MQRRDLPPELSFAAIPAVEPRELTSPPPSRRPKGAEPEVVSVAELDRRLKRILEGSTADVRVEGEISSLRVVGSGHAYFTLKDESEEAAGGHGGRRYLGSVWSMRLETTWPTVL